MCMNNKESNNVCCCLFTIIATLLSAIGIATIFYSGLIVSVATLLYITLILGILGLLYVVFTAFCGGRHQCAEIKNTCLITSIVGSIVTSIFALTVTALATASISSAILVGVVAFFLISNSINIINLIVSKLCKGCCND